MKNKTELIADLNAAGVQGITDSMTLAQLQSVAAEHGVSIKKEKPAAPELITVTATTALFEAGERYAAGDSFQTTPDRAAALGSVVTIAG